MNTNKNENLAAEFPMARNEVKKKTGSLLWGQRLISEFMYTS